MEKGGNMALALLNHKIIVGFAVLDAPDAEDRWARIGKPVVMELKAVEVLREFRNHGIARHLLDHLFSDPELNKKIIYLTAYSWIWDLDFSGLPIESYRNMLCSLYAGYGFFELPTNESNICLKPENIFMVRMGRDVSKRDQENFKWLRFGVFL